jgi:hypothetical protein
MRDFQVCVQDTIGQTGRVVRENAGVLRRSLKLVNQLMDSFRRGGAAEDGQYDAQGTDRAARGMAPALIDQKG